MVRKRNVVILCWQTFILESVFVLEQLCFKFLVQNRHLPKNISGENGVKTCYCASLSKIWHFLLKIHSGYQGRLQELLLGNQYLHHPCFFISVQAWNRHDVHKWPVRGLLWIWRKGLCPLLAVCTVVKTKWCFILYVLFLAFTSFFGMLSGMVRYVIKVDFTVKVSLKSGIRHASWH